MSERAPRPATDGAIDAAALVRAFSALAQPSRLAVFLHVVAAGPEGVPLQGLAALVNTTGSALTLHLRALDTAGLIQVQLRRRRPQSPWVVARIERCAELGSWLADHCREAGWSIDPESTVDRRSSAISK